MSALVILSTLAGAAPSEIAQAQVGSQGQSAVGPPPACRVDPAPSGPLLDRGVVPEQWPRKPAGWVPPDPGAFDWDGDGTPDDRLVIANGEVTVQWATGSVTVTGVRTDFGRDAGADVTPAAVGNFTGDGLLDLAVVQDGELAVLVGQGSATPSGTIPFDRIGVDREGWRSPSVATGDNAGGFAELPGTAASVHPLWDVDGNGVTDVAVSTDRRRARGPWVLYSGRPCNGGAAPTPPRPTPRSPAAIPQPGSGPQPVYTGDFPDPDLERFDKTYFVYGTNGYTPASKWRNLPVMSSDDLVSWSDPVEALPSLGSWATPGWTWSPAVHRFGNTFVAFYTARSAADGMQCIGRATSSSPTGHFVDSSNAPFRCDAGLGGSIDADVFTDRDGNPWLLFKTDGNSDACRCNSALWSAPLSSTGSTLVGRVRPLLVYEDTPVEAPTIESPTMVDSAFGSWLFYSSGLWSSRDYREAVASCPVGPTDWCVRANRSWMTSTGSAGGPGGASFATDRVGRSWMAYHAWRNNLVGYENFGVRSLYVSRVGFGPGGPALDASVKSSQDPIGSLDVASASPGALDLAGWAIDPDTTSPVTVHVYVDSTFAGAYIADASRPDVGGAFPGYGAAHGYAVTIPTTAGVHNMCVFAINVGAGSTNPPLGCATVRVT